MKTRFVLLVRGPNTSHPNKQNQFLSQEIEANWFLAQGVPPRMALRSRPHRQSPEIDGARTSNQTGRVQLEWKMFCENAV